MRFDDTLETVLAGDVSSPFGMQSAWRQLVDLIGRRRVPPDARALSTLHTIRPHVPAPVRAASARGLEYADPPMALVRLFAVDDIKIAAPVLRTARLTSSEWIALLPDISSAARAVLRGRRELGPAVKRALDAFGSADFILAGEPSALAEAPAAEVVSAEEVAPAAEAEPIDWNDVIASPAPVMAVNAPQPAPASELEMAQDRVLDWAHVVASPAPEGVEPPEPVEPVAALPVPAEPPQPPLVLAPERARLPDPIAAPAVAAEPQEAAEEDFSFVALAGVAASYAAGAVQAVPAPAPPESGTASAEPADATVAEPGGVAQGPAMTGKETMLAERDTAAAAQEAEAEPEAQREAGPGADPEGPFQISEVVARIDAFWRRQQEAPESPSPVREPEAAGFRFETDLKGVIRWVEGVSRAPLVGLSLDLQGVPGTARVDGVAAGAFRRRAGFSNARLSVEGETDAAGDWLISGIPVFDPASGRFTGYRGTARRPRTDERAEPSRPAPATPADSLRQLVHELRTPTNAIAGFAEMIETQILGPVPEPYRDRAGVIRTQAKELLGAIDDLDLAARIESDALALVPGTVALRPLLCGIADDLAPLAELRGSWIALPVDNLSVSGDRRAVERLLSRLMATLVSASDRGERVGVRMGIEGADTVAIWLERPAALADFPGEAMLGIDDEGSDATLLGTGFALRLARNLAKELDGSLVIGADSLTLRLPAAVSAPVEQAHLN
ncbi:sensor histidine kinase [Sphingosinithalassobacter sp. CS137]|uniref:sensor histidine kinase n=1 Tax=Sphingosinithalassobacter sp. CS137 TaxID=2762748 RepID=UPI0021CFD60B|nr:HAMP domain-containing sensor histidine kinase [Sphingosinithalassobacter sp. CS137]